MRQLLVDHRLGWVSGLLLSVMTSGAVGAPSTGAHAAPVPAATLAAVVAQISRSAAERELERIEHQIAALQSRLETLRDERSTIVEDFEAADIELALSRRQLRLVRIRLRAVSQELPQREREVERLEASSHQAREELASRIVALYRMGPLSYSRVLLAADSADEVLTGYQLMIRMAAQDRRLINTVRIRLGELDVAIAALRETQERLARLQAREADVVATLEVQQNERQQIIRRIDIEAASDRQILAQHHESAAALESLIAGLVDEADVVAGTAGAVAGVADPDPTARQPTERESDERQPDEREPVEGEPAERQPAEGESTEPQQAESESTERGPAAGESAERQPAEPAAEAEEVAPTATPAAVLSFDAARGILPWPGDGPISLGFGRQRHPVYDIYTLSKGIEIGAPAGSSVRAVFRGRVAFADWFKGYGLVVILSHGREFFTLYGHLATVNVRVGDYLDPLAEIGTVGDTGSLTGSNLYFEIRQGAEALNPVRWLRPR